MVFRYLQRINSGFTCYDLHFILYNTDKSISVRFKQTEVKKQHVTMVHKQSKQEIERMAREQAEAEAEAKKAAKLAEKESAKSVSV